jgi:hypothetical protein
MEGSEWTRVEGPRKDHRAGTNGSVYLVRREARELVEIL